MLLIRLSQALDDMKSNGPFTIEFVKADRKRKTGGEIARIEQATLSSNNGQMINVRRPGQARPVPVHIRLITEFNGKKTVY
jgi:hypothetical protein